MLSNRTTKTILPLPAHVSITTARSRLISSLPLTGYGSEHLKHHLESDIAPALSQSSQSSTYYGFITGGATNAAKFADHMAVEYDQNVQVHLPNETIATDVEDSALNMLLQLVGLASQSWPHRTFTTGATASNVLGLALGRQSTLVLQSLKKGSQPLSVAEDGIFAVMKQAGIDHLQVLTTVPHSSLRKAASIVGLGRAAIIDVGRIEESHRFDFKRLEELLGKPNTASIVAISFSEVNTGLFATSGTDMLAIRKLCNQYNAWLHVDAAFGLLARVLPDTQEYRYLLDGAAGLEHADSITGDAHKLLNVPYDCGFFFSKSLDCATEVFKNPNAAYLSSLAGASIPSPLNIGIENSRRFRALPVYATLAAYGRDGYSNMMERQVNLARSIAEFIMDSPGYELLPVIPSTRAYRLQMIYMVVLFRAKSQEMNKVLVQRINATREIYVSGTVWDGQPAARFAVANWQADLHRDLQVVKEVLNTQLSAVA